MSCFLQRKEEVEQGEERGLSQTPPHPTLEIEVQNFCPRVYDFCHFLLSYYDNDFGSDQYIKVSHVPLGLLGY